MKLSQLASTLAIAKLIGDPNIKITGIKQDHRLVQQGDVFVCLAGLVHDGHKYAEAAVEQGAVALVTERHLELNIPQIIVKDSRYALAQVANLFYDYPSRKMKMIGITGTNGKTTTSLMIEKILSDANFQTGLLGTVKMKIGDREVIAERTTPGALELQSVLHKMANLHTDYCVMEVSSHALAQNRVLGVEFRTAIFTNLTQDHLDYHKTMEDYMASKGLLFSRLGNAVERRPKMKYAILNADDSVSEVFARSTAAQCITYGIEQDADVRARHVQLTSHGLAFDVETYAGSAHIVMKMVGKFNVYNALAAIAATLVEGVSFEQIMQSLYSIEGIEGRMQAVQVDQPFAVLVDYAHTPDSLENVLETICEFAQGKVITVFGCGGDRDRSKRGMMGAVAVKYSDYVIITSDNPRTEDPAKIMSEIEEGLVAHHDLVKDKYEKIMNRKQAIEKAVAMASPNDVLLIAGKGHETYQEINGIQYDFDDRIVAEEAIRSLMK